MSEEKEKPLTITLKVIIPIRDIMFAIKQVFPFIEISVEEEKKPTIIPPASSVDSGRPMTDPLGVPPQTSFCLGMEVVNYKPVDLPPAYSGQGETIKLEPEEEKKPEEAPPVKPEG